MVRTKQKARPSGPTPAKKTRTLKDEPPVEEQTKDNGQECVSDSEQDSWQDLGDEDMKELFAAEEAETQAQAEAQAHADEDTLSDDDDDDNEAGTKDPEKKPPAKRARTGEN